MTIYDVETSQTFMFLSFVVWLHSSSEAAAPVVCFTQEEKPAVAWWHNGTMTIIVLVWIAYLAP